jgi:hypothetical protein
VELLAALLMQNASNKRSTRMSLLAHPIHHWMLFDNLSSFGAPFFICTCSCVFKKIDIWLEIWLEFAKKKKTLVGMWWVR